MAKQISTQPLSFTELVMRADAATLKAAYEARLKVDELLAQREEAYRRIAELEQQVDQVMGEPGLFVFPEPPMPVAGFAAKKNAAPKAAPAVSPAEASPISPVATEEVDDSSVAPAEEPQETTHSKRGKH